MLWLGTTSIIVLKAAWTDYVPSGRGDRVTTHTKWRYSGHSFEDE